MCNRPAMKLRKERTKRKTRQLKSFRVHNSKNLWKVNLSWRHHHREQQNRKKTCFALTFYYFLTFYISFLKQKLITFLSIGFKSMSLKRTIIYSVFLISFVTSVSFLNLNLAFKSVDRSPADAGHRLGLHETFRRCHGHLLSASCASDLCPVTTGNCHHFKYYWIIFTVSIIFIQTTLQPKVESPFCYHFFDTVYHSIPFAQCCLS